MKRNGYKVLHKGACLVFASIILVCVTGITCFAKESSYASMDKAEDIIDDFYDVIPDEVGDATNPDSAVEAIGVRRILGAVADAIKDESGELCAFLLTILGIALIGALASQSFGEMGAFTSRAVYIVSSALLMQRLIFLVNGVSEALNEIGSFFGAVIPISVAVNSLGVSPSTASTQAVGMGITLGVYTFLAEKALLPIVGAIFALSAASAIDPLLGRLSRSIKRLFLTCLGILTVLISATFSLQTSIAASADSALMRGAKYAISSAVPIVGSTVSGALGVLGGSVAYARGVVGGGAIAVLITVMLAPAVILFTYRTCLKLGVNLSSLCAIDECEGVISPFLEAVDALLGVYLLTCIVYIVEMTAFMKGGASVA